MRTKIDINRFIEIFSNIIDESEILSEKCFDKIKDYVKIKSSSVYFLSPENLEKIYPNAKETIKISQNLSKELYGEKHRDLSFLSEKTHYVTYLKIKGTVYGIILFEKEKFTEEEKAVLNAITKIISYKIKDEELTKIFNTQLTTLTKAITGAKKAEQIKTDFISNISHELRTPLNSILGFSDILNNPKTGTLNEVQKEYINDIQISSLHLLEMINEILDMSKIENNSKKTVKQQFRISQAVTEVTTILYPLIKEKNIKLTQSIKDTEIYSDYQKIKQILFNLISNAIKFTRDEINIEIEEEEEEERSKKNIVIKIRDNGIGIEKKNQKKIFKKFEQVKNAEIKNEASTGLGLTITKEFVKLINGKITVESEPNKGACFTVILPKS